MKNLALQIRKIDSIEINQTERTDPGGSKVKRRRRTQTAGADAEDPRGLQPSVVSYGVPDGAPAICQANASGDEAVRSIAGSTVE